MCKEFQVLCFNLYFSSKFLFVIAGSLQEYSSANRPSARIGYCNGYARNKFLLEINVILVTDKYQCIL